MPPRAAPRRSNRSVVRDSAASSSPVANFQKPNLPPLQGTPSSRRQYTYGAEVEPQPSRPGRGLPRGQMIDLGSAVRNVLTRHEQEHETDKAARPPSRSRKETRADADEDELAAEAPKFRPAAPSMSLNLQPPRLAAVAQEQSSDSSEADDARSFGIESDYYGDATIASTPASVDPAASTRNATSVTSTSRAQQSKSSYQLQSSRLEELPEEDIPEARRPSSTFQEAARVVAKRSNKSAENDVERPGKANPPVPRRSTRNMLDDDDIREEEVEFTSSRAGLRQRQANTTSSRQPSANELSKVNAAAPASPPKSDLRTALHDQALSAFATTTEVLTENPRLRQRGKGQRTKNLFAGNGRTLQSEAQQEPNGEQTRDGAKRFLVQERNVANTTNPFSLKNLHRSDHSERDDAVQRDIRQEIREAEDELTREEQQRAREARLRVWRERWDWIKTYPPLSLFIAEQIDQGTEDDSDESELGRHDATNWWEFLHPWTYIRAILWLIGGDTLADRDFRVQSPFSRQAFAKFFTYAMYMCGGILALILAVTMGSVAITSLRNSSLGFPSISTGPGISLPSLGDVTGKIGEYIPDIPWPSRSRWNDLPELWELDTTERGEVEDLFKRYSQEVNALKNSRNLHETSLKKLEAVVPKVVHMQLKDGKPVVAQEFYHGLRDLAHEDDRFMTFDKQGDEYQVSSEKHWRAIASRLGNDPTFTSKLNLSIDELEGRLDHKMSNSWDAWVRNNNGKISEMLGSELDKIQLGGTDKEFDKRLSKIVKEQLTDSYSSGTVVGRDEFLRHLKNEFAAHRSEIRAELSEMQPRLEQHVRHTLEMANQNTPPSMSRADITTLVHGLVRQSIADMNLEAMAKGKIHAHWDADLKNQVNYFNMGSGAIVNAKHSSLTYNPIPKAGHKKGVVQDGLFSHGLRDSRPLPHVEALLPWTDEGDCWCAARSYNHRGNPHGASLVVQLAQTIVPQHVVVEHILPGATTDPDARPRDIEVYAGISDPAARERARDFSATHFRDDESDRDFQAAELPEEFVKIGQFVYESSELLEGAHVHRLSEELLALGAETDHVVVRAVSNYGAKEHTCFYRVRLYGHRVDPEV